MPRSGSHVTGRLRQEEARAEVGYGAIRLRREDDFALVEVEFSGRWVEVIREHTDGNFCHIVEPVGIAEKLRKAGCC